MLGTFLPFVLLGIGVFFLPLTWGLRAWATAALLLVWTEALTPMTPFQNQGPFDGLQGLLLLWVFVFVTLGVAVRAFWTLARAPLDWSSLSKDMLGPDSMLAVLFGLVAGMAATLLIATGLRGVPGGLILHVAVAGLAAVGIHSAMRLPQRSRCMVVTAMSTLLCLTLVGRVAYPKLILSRAEVIQPGVPRCLRTPDGRAPTTDQMRLLTLPKAQSRRPSLVLTLMTSTGPRDFRWSYRSFAFRTYDSYTGGPCPSP